MTLTDKWKKGELEVGEYYLRYKDGTIDREYYDYANVYDLMIEKGFSTESCDISEVLAPVPSYEEWQELKDVLNTHKDYCCCAKNEVLLLENQQLKELFKECKANLIHRKQLLEKLDKLEKPTKELLTKIDNAIGEKK